MKVLIINTVSFAINGMSTIITDMYKNMDKTMFKFDFAVKDFIDEKYKKEIEKNGDRYFVFERNYKQLYKYINKLSDLIKKEKYDIVHIHGNSALMLVELNAIKKSGMKCVKVVHAHNTQCTHQMCNKILHKKFIKSYDYALACSDAAGKWLYKDNSYTVINNGIEEKRFVYNENLREKERTKNALEDKFTLLHIGRFNSQKNHTFLIDIFSELIKTEPNAILRLVGDGQFVDDIKMKVNKLRLRDKVTFVGTTNNTEAEYNMADVFVLPSLYESFGIVNVEAQCSGLPCVISDTIPEAIKITDNVDFVSLNKSAKEWAKIILKYHDAQKRKSYDNEVRKYGFSIIENAQKLRKFYEKII